MKINVDIISNNRGQWWKSENYFERVLLWTYFRKCNFCGGDGVDDEGDVDDDDNDEDYVDDDDNDEDDDDDDDNDGNDEDVGLKYLVAITLGKWGGQEESRQKQNNRSRIQPSPSYSCCGSGMNIQPSSSF